MLNNTLDVFLVDCTQRICVWAPVNGLLLEFKDTSLE